MSDTGDQPRVKRSRFDSNGPAPNSAPHPVPPSKEAAKQALEKAKKLLELSKLKDKLKNSQVWESSTTVFRDWRLKG